MRKLLSILAFLVGALSINLEDAAAMSSQDYEEVLCKSHKGGFLVAFIAGARTRSRDFAFEYKKRTLHVGLSNLTGPVGWDDVKAIIYRELSAGKGHVSIEFVRPVGFTTPKGKKVSRLDFGLVTQGCWEKIVDAVGSDILTDFRPM